MGKFQPGQSGNPAGKPKGIKNRVSKSAAAQAAFAALVEPELERIFNALMTVLDNEPDDKGKLPYRGSEVIAAARELLDRCLGKPVEHLMVSPEESEGAGALQWDTDE